MNTVNKIQKENLFGKTQYSWKANKAIGYLQIDIEL